MPIIRAAGSIPDSKEKGIQRDTTYQVPSKDYKGRVREYREYQTQKKAYDEDQSSYAQAEAERPTYSRGDTVEGDTVYGDPVDYSQALSAWSTKYSDTLGVGEDRYEKEKTFLEEADQTITQEIAHKEVAPYGVGIDVNKLLSDTDAYQVVETYTGGAPKKIQAKPKVYTSQTGYSGQQVGTYIPYEATLSEEGKLVEERTKGIGTARSYWSRGDGTSTQYKPYEKTVLSYTAGLPKELKAQAMYKTGGDRSSGWSYSYYGKGPQTEITFGEGGTLGTKAVYDIAQKSMRMSGEFGKTSRYEPFLDKFYDYGKQEVLDYPTPMSQSNIMGSKSVQELIQSGRDTKPTEPTHGTPKPSRAPKPTEMGIALGSFYKSTKTRDATQQFGGYTPMPTASRRDVKSTVYENPYRPGTYLSWDVNPSTGSRFNSQEEYLRFWNASGRPAPTVTKKNNRNMLNMNMPIQQQAKPTITFFDSYNNVGKEITKFLGMNGTKQYDTINMDMLK